VLFPTRYPAAMPLAGVLVTTLNRLERGGAGVSAAYDSTGFHEAVFFTTPPSPSSPPCAAKTGPRSIWPTSSPGRLALCGIAKGVAPTPPGTKLL
jgi:hypothetical protein